MSEPQKMPRRKKSKRKAEKLSKSLSQLQVSERPAEIVPHILMADEIQLERLAMFPKLSKKVPTFFYHGPFPSFSTFIEQLSNLQLNIFVSLVGCKYIRITCKTNEDHRKLIEYSNEQQLPYHTYGYPSDRRLSVVVKGLPNDIDLKKVKKEIKTVGIPVDRIHKMERKICKGDKILLLVVVPHNADGLNILKITDIFGNKVSLEPLKVKAKQCHRCQKWGHSQRYCRGESKCVKCGGGHLTRQCREKLCYPVCANCGEAHTANYPKCSHRPVSKKSQAGLEIKAK